MRQQINLYQPIFRKERKLFSAPTVAVACGLVALAYFGFFAFGTYKVEHLEEEVGQLRRQAEAQQTMLNTTAQLRAQRAKPVDIEANIERLTRELSERSRALDVLQSGEVGEPVGFATRLEALARGHLEGVWLDHLVLTGAAGSAGSLRLEGATLDPDLVPRYLQRLATEEALQGTRFGQFAIERGDKKTTEDTTGPTGLRFTVTSPTLMQVDEEPT